MAEEAWPGSRCYLISPHIVSGDKGKGLFWLLIKRAWFLLSNKCKNGQGDVVAVPSQREQWGGINSGWAGSGSVSILYVNHSLSYTFGFNTITVTVCFLISLLLTVNCSYLSTWSLYFMLHHSGKDEGKREWEIGMWFGRVSAGDTALGSTIHKPRQQLILVYIPNFIHTLSISESGNCKNLNCRILL